MYNPIARSVDRGASDLFFPSSNRGSFANRQTRRKAPVPMWARAVTDFRRSAGARRRNHDRRRRMNRLWKFIWKTGRAVGATLSRNFDLIAPAVALPAFYFRSRSLQPELGTIVKRTLLKFRRPAHAGLLLNDITSTGLDWYYFGWEIKRNRRKTWRSGGLRFH